MEYRGICEQGFSDRPPELPFSDSEASPYAAIGQITVMAGVDDAMAVFNSGLLLARSLRATLRLTLPEGKDFEVHFGRAPCGNLLLGVMEAVRRQLSRLAFTAGGDFAVEISMLPAGRSIAIRLRNLNDVS